MVDLNNFHNRRVNGFTIESLNMMEYKDREEIDDPNALPFNIDCNYVLPHLFRKPSNSLSVMSFNIRSMKTNWVNFKAELMNGVDDCEVIGMCETHLTNATEKLYTLQGYDCFTSNVSSHMDGVCLFVRSSLSCKVRDDLVVIKNHLESIFVECIINKEALVIGMIYHRPGTSSHLFLEHLSKILDKISSKCLVMGDLNTNLLDNNTKKVIDLISLFKEHSCLPCITKPTRVANNTATIIDHIWFNHADTNDLESKIIFTDVSDHFPVVLNVPVIQKITSYKTISYRMSGDACDMNFKDNLENYDFTDLMGIYDVNQAFERFNDIIYNMYSISYPEVVKRIKVNEVHQPWLTAGIKQSIKTKNKLYKKFIKRPITFGLAYRQYRNILTRTIKASKNAHYMQKFSLCSGNSKLTWKTLNKLLGKGCSSQSKVMKIDNVVTDNSNLIANRFNEYYANIAGTITNELPVTNRNFNDYLEPRNIESIIWEPTNVFEIKRIVKKLNTVTQLARIDVRRMLKFALKIS